MHHDVICFASVHQLLLGPAVHMSSTMVDSEHCMTSCWDCVIMFLNILPTICIYSELHYLVSAWWKYIASVAPNPQKHSLSLFCFTFGTFSKLLFVFKTWLNVHHGHWMQGVTVGQDNHGKVDVGGKHRGSSLHMLDPAHRTVRLGFNLLSFSAPFKDLSAKDPLVTAALVLALSSTDSGENIHGSLNTVASTITIDQLMLHWVTYTSNLDRSTHSRISGKCTKIQSQVAVLWCGVLMICIWPMVSLLTSQCIMVRDQWRISDEVD